MIEFKDVGVVELADTLGLGSNSTRVGVQVPSPIIGRKCVAQ